jgi:hypothetical protein
MDLRMYYQKIREMEATIVETYPVVVSLPTGDGGKAGVLAEVPRRVAAKMLLDGTALMATPEQVQLFVEQNALAAKEAADKMAASKMSFALMTPDDLRKIRGDASSPKD